MSSPLRPPRLLPLLAATVLGLAVLAAAPTRPAPATPGPAARANAVATPSPDVTGLLVRLHERNRLETEAGRIGARNAASTAVKSFAKSLVADENAADREVLDYAAVHGVDLGADGDGIDRAAREAWDALDRLAKLKGDAFDRAWSEWMHDLQSRDAKSFEAARDGIADQKLRNILIRMRARAESHRKTIASVLHRLRADDHETSVR